MLSAASDVMGQYYYCPPGYEQWMPYGQAHARSDAQSGQPTNQQSEQQAGQEDQQQVESTQQAEQTFTSSSNDFTSASETFAPNMIGDRLGGPSIPVQYTQYGHTGTVDVGSATSLTIGRIKLSDNNSPLPRDRVFFDYSYFHNVPTGSRAVNVNRVTPGFEKTFLSGTGSVDIRMPLLYALDDEQIVSGTGLDSDYSGEFGDLGVTFKLLLMQSRWLTVSYGLGVTVPTSDDLELRDYLGSTLLQINSTSVHLTPYLAAVATNDVFFTQGFLQFDVDTNGNRVYTRSVGAGGQGAGFAPSVLFLSGVGSGVNDLEFIGRYRDQTFMYLDVAAGVWLYRNNYTRGLSGVAAIFEVHYTQSIESLDTLANNNGTFRIGGDVRGADDNFSLVNFTAGLTTTCGYGKSTTIGYAFPMTGGRSFDGEIRASLNWYF